MSVCLSVCQSLNLRPHTLFETCQELTLKAQNAEKKFGKAPAKNKRTGEQADINVFLTLDDVICIITASYVVF